MNFLSVSGAGIAIFSVLGAVWLIALILFCLAVFIRRAAFSRRCDKNPLLKYFSAEDFGLKSQTVEILKDGKYTLRAAVYAKDGPQKPQLIIFCHGMGPGHIAYTTEIAYFCNLGYTVLAPDYYGCNLSDGKNIGDFSFGRLTVECAVDYARNVMLGFEKIYLVGHSWGGWAAICAGCEKKVDKIVAISAPDRADRAILHAASSRLPKFLTVLLKPFVRFTCGDKSAAKLAKKATCPILLVHGGEDNTVPEKNAVYYAADGEHIKKLLVKAAGHNPYNTLRAEQKLKELTSALQNAQNTGEEYFKQFDFSAATEEDGAVMSEIARFLEQTQ